MLPNYPFYSSQPNNIKNGLLNSFTRQDYPTHNLLPK